jgi:site-specific DNA-methyltransferase (adenine-specific)
MTPYLELQEPKCLLYNTDVLQAGLAPESVDLIVTSPPYNVEVVYGTHRDDLSYADYLEFCEAWLKRCYEWLKPDGRMCLNIPLDKNKGGQQSVGADLTTLAKRLGFQYHSTIVWNEGNISRRTAWGSWVSASAPYVIAPVELIVVLYKREWKKTSGTRISDITPQEFVEWTNGLWTFNGESRKRVGHPAPFPLELPKRCIKLFSYVGDTVLDPFAGSGTTLLAAIMHNRHAIGVEIEPAYCELAKQRIMQYLYSRQLALSVETVGNREWANPLRSVQLSEESLQADRDGEANVYSAAQLAEKEGDQKMVEFCREVLSVYERHGVNDHIRWE